MEFWPLFDKAPNRFPAVTKNFSFGGIAVQLLVPEPQSIFEAYGKASSDQTQPYWSRVWPSSLGLCTFLAQHSNLIRDKRVLELAAGLGLPSLYTAHLAKEVCCTDYIPEALEWARASSRLNNLERIQFAVADWNHLPSDLDPEVLLLSDINYDPKSFDTLLLVLEHFIFQGTTILLSTPQRLIAKPFIEQLLPFCRQMETVEVNTNAHVVPVSVLVLKQ